MRDLLRRLEYGCFIVAIIASLWTAAWAKAKSDEAQRSIWPAEHPEMFQWQPVQ